MLVLVCGWTVAAAFTALRTISQRTNVTSADGNRFPAPASWAAEGYR